MPVNEKSNRKLDTDGPCGHTSSRDERVSIPPLPVAQVGIHDTAHWHCSRCGYAVPATFTYCTRCG